MQAIKQSFRVMNHAPDQGPAKEKTGNPGTGALAARLEMVRVERAVYDLRRGLPVVIAGAGNMGLLVASSELIDAEVLGYLSAEGAEPPQIQITHRRAETLKIRLYTEEVISLSLPDRAPLDFITHLADPARDLDYPLSGPFQAERTAPGEARIAAVHLTKLAGLLPSVVSVPLSGEKYARRDAETFARTEGLLRLTAPEILDYERSAAGKLRPVSPVTSAKVPLAGAQETRVTAFRPLGPDGGGPEHLALSIGAIDTSKPVLLRLHSECFTGDLLGSLKCDCGDQLRGAINEIAAEGSGILLYLAQEGRGIGLMNKLRAYALQDQGFDTVEANLRLGFEVDERLFAAAAEMLHQLGVSTVRLMTNNPDKVASLEACGIKVAERVAHAFPSNEHNAHYLATKADKTGHLL